MQEFVICHNSLLQDKMIQQIEWPKNCLLVSIKRSGNELIPKGKTILFPGDVLVTLTDEKDAPAVYDYMEEVCAEKKE